MSQITSAAVRPSGTDDVNPFDTPGGKAKAEQRRATAAASEERCKEWGRRRYAVAELEAVTDSWARELRDEIARKDALRDPVQKPPTLMYPGSEAVRKKATDDQMRALHALTDDEIAAVKLDEAAHRAHSQRQVVEMARKIGTRRVPLRSSLLTLAELADLTPPTPLIDGLIYCRTLAQLIGEPGSYKSFTAVAMACSVATGAPLGSHQVPKSVPVVYVAAEGADGIYLRVAAWCHRHGIDPTAMNDTFRAIPRPVQLGDVEDMAELTEIVAAFGAKLVIIDTRAKSTEGLEENSATDQGLAIGNAERLIAATGATVLTVHHNARATNRGRGSSAWDGAVHSTLVQKSDAEHTSIECTKHKDAPDGCIHPFALERVTPPGGVESLVLVPSDPLAVALEGTGETVNAVVEMIKSHGGEQGLTRADIVRIGTENVNGRPRIAGRTALYKAVTDAVNMALIKPSGKGRFPVFTVFDPEVGR